MRFTLALVVAAVLSPIWSIAANVHHMGALARRTTCMNSVPGGWIKVSDLHNPTQCGGSGNDPSSWNYYNVWIIEPFAGAPVGMKMNACAGTVPGGWNVVRRWTDFTQCHTNGSRNNMETIQRVH